MSVCAMCDILRGGRKPAIEEADGTPIDQPLLLYTHKRLYSLSDGLVCIFLKWPVHLFSCHLCIYFCYVSPGWVAKPLMEGL